MPDSQMPPDRDFVSLKFGLPHDVQTTTDHLQILDRKKSQTFTLPKTNIAPEK